MARMEIHVLYIANDTGTKHHFTCDEAERTLKDGYASIKFVNGVHVEAARKVLSAQYAQPVYIMTYEEQEPKTA